MMGKSKHGGIKRDIPIENVGPPFYQMKNARKDTHMIEAGRRKPMV
jgi:hypothetical protein